MMDFSEPSTFGNDGTITELSRSTYLWKIENLYLTNCHFRSRRFNVWRHMYEFYIEISPKEIGYGYLRLYLLRGNILKSLPMFLQMTYGNKIKKGIVNTAQLNTSGNNVFYSLGSYKTKGLNEIKFQYLMEPSKKAIAIGYKSNDKVEIFEQCVVRVDSVLDRINTKTVQLVPSTGNQSAEAVRTSGIFQLNSDKQKAETLISLSSIGYCKFINPRPSVLGEITSVELKGLRNLSEDLKDIFFSKEDSDIMIKVGSECYPAHKMVLKSRSSVFKAMLRHNKLETKQGFIDITDCDPYIFYYFLKFLYTGKLDSISKDNISELYRMSDKYDVKVLKEHCVEVIANNLNTENICDVISLAIAHSESDLLASATEFFTDNAKSIVTTLAWQVFLKDNPTQANELFIKTLYRDSRTTFSDSSS